MTKSEWQYKDRLTKPRVSNTPELDPATITKKILSIQPTSKVNAVDLSSQTDISLTQMPADPWENSEKENEK